MNHAFIYEYTYIRNMKYIHL